VAEKKEKGKVSSIGGQALLEGVMMRGKGAMAMAVRSPEGNILLQTKRLKSAKSWYKRIFIIRGLAAFFISLVTGVDTLLKSAAVSAPEEETPSKGWMGFSVVLGLGLGIALFILLPSLLAGLLFDGDSVLLSSLTEGVIRIGIFVLYLFSVGFMKDIRRTFMYHGAEHRTINCYEKGLDMTVENVQKCSTRHNRCGTTFLFFVMIVSILLFSLANWLFWQIGINPNNYGGVALVFIKFGIRLALLPLVAGLSYELLRFLAALPDNAFTNILRAPGLALQRLSTREPDDSMAAVALKSFLAVAEMDGNENVREVKFGQMSLTEARKIIADDLAGTDADKAEADWILCDALKCRRAALASIAEIDMEQYRRIKAVTAERKKGRPLWYVLGYTDFYGIRMRICEGALIPRPETELLCERAIQIIKEREGAQTVLDLCTGSGCVALAIAKNTDASVTASDVSDGAIAAANENLLPLKDRVRVVKSDMFAEFSGKRFDIIVCNPPYVASADVDTLDRSVKDFEPRIALDGGADGLGFYRKIAACAYEHLNNGGVLLLEVGAGQAGAVAELLGGKFKNIAVKKDLNGIERIIECAYVNE
jgi:release factor-specific protein-(glutamine-N5) methyltransferase